MNDKVDIGIVGGGIVGISHAYAFLQKGLSVALFEKDSFPRGATVRNFGQIVPSGFGKKWQAFGRKSLETYKDLQKQTDITLSLGGSVYIASDDEELQLLEELHEINKTNDYESHLWTKSQCLQKYPNSSADYVKGALFFPDEVTIDPTLAAERILKFLVDKYDLNYYPNHHIISCEEKFSTCVFKTTDGKKYESQIAVIANGSDFKTLFPETFQNAGIKLVKLQMLSTYPQTIAKINGSVLTGQTVRRYESFQECKSYKEIKGKENQDSFFRKYGVHILFKQSKDGRVIIGDSHEYFDVTKNEKGEFYTSHAINDFIISEAKKILNLDHWNIERSWNGYYSQCDNRDVHEERLGRNIHIVTAIGGKGMTASFGFAEESSQKILEH